MRLATWNVNSIRSRADRVAAFLERHDVDVLTVITSASCTSQAGRTPVSISFSVASSSTSVSTVDRSATLRRISSGSTSRCVRLRRNAAM